MHDPRIKVGCPFVYDLNPDFLRQCQKARGHGGGHQWNGREGFYIKWSEKLVATPRSETSKGGG